MKRTATEAPYLSFCMVVRNCEKTLEETLKSIRDRSPQCELVIVDTCSSDSTPDIAQRYADVFEVYTGPEGTWNKDMYAVDDMSAARQRSFELATGVWRAWADGDDRVVGGEEAIKLLQQNGRYCPQPAQLQTREVLSPETDGAGKDEQGKTGLEDILRWFEGNRPEVTMIWCPYLYQKDEHGNAIQWQERERFVKWSDPPKFHWAEAAHEVLVPVDPNYLPPRVDLAHLLWVHEKDWSPQAYDYSIRRHCAIMLKQFDAGDITYRRCRYLANFSAHLFPERELEILHKGHEVAWTDVDRYRSLIDLGNHYSRRGLYQDAREYYGAAVDQRADLPDAWYAGGSAAIDAEDWLRAADWLRRGTKCEISPWSEINPRFHVIRFPTLLSVALVKAGEQLDKAGAPDASLPFYQEAMEVAYQVLNRPEVGADAREAHVRWLRARNKFLGQRAVISLREVWKYLRDNDEPQKALALLDAFPWNQEDSLPAVAMEQWSRKIKRHIQSPEAYREFYNSMQETGYVPMEPEQYLYEHTQQRVQWAVDWIKAHAPQASVLDVGCCDGIAGIPLLTTCESVTYRGVDVSEEALKNFERLLEHHNVAGRSERVRLEQGELPSDDQKYDVVLLGEIIEHVRDPIAWLRKMATYLNPDGSLLITTPWGSFDDGKPPEHTAYGTPRDDRGHLRAYSARQIWEDFRAAGLRCGSLSHLGSEAEGGHAMVAQVTPERRSRRPIAVAVAGALWDWNGSKIDREGIGASEEIIVRLGEYLQAERDYNVFGPVPEAEIYKGVGYFPQNSIRKIDPRTKILISRAPGYHRVVDQLVGREHPMVLWLQDTTYPDLNADVARRYESIVCVSEWHKQLTAQAHNVPLEKIKVAYNFVQREHFADGIKTAWEGLKKRDHFIYASSPDRGLLKLLRLWPRIREHFPDATLSIFYGWKGAAKLGAGQNAQWNQRFLTMKREYEELRHQPGITEVGMVNHYQIALEFQRAGVWSYSSDFHETGCATACKARAGGAVPVTSALAALNETAACEQGILIPVPESGEYPDYYDDMFIEGVRQAVEVSDADRIRMAEECLDKFSYEAIAPVWDDILGD